MLRKALNKIHHILVLVAASFFKLTKKAKNAFADYAGVDRRKGKVLFVLLGCFFIFVVPAVFLNRPLSETPPVEDWMEYSFFPEPGSSAAVVMDAATGTFIFLKNPDMEIPPASLTKIMTMHLIFKEIAAGRASLDEIIVPPPESWAVNQPPRSSLMFLADGQQLSLEELLVGLAVPSGNDAAVAAALRFAPSVEEFAEMMNREAASIGLEKTRFVEPSGISYHNMTTAREFAHFTRFYLGQWPESLAAFHSLREFTFPQAHNMVDSPGVRLRTITQRNSNTLLHSFEGTDGIRTGFIYASGFNVALTAERNGTRFIAIILGAPATAEGRRIRDQDGQQLLEWAFSYYRTIRPRLEGLPLAPVRVWRGMDDYALIDLGAPLAFTAHVERGENINWRIENSPLIAPLPLGSYAGTLVLYDSEGDLHSVPLVTRREVQSAGYFKQLFDSVNLFFTTLTN